MTSSSPAERKPLSELWAASGMDADAALADSGYFHPPSGGFTFLLDGVTNELTDAPGVWVAVNGGGLPCPVRLRLARGAGKVVVTGLVVGELGDHTITSETLRAIRLPEIVAALFESFDPSVPPPDPSSTGNEFMDEFRAWAAHELFRELVADRLPATEAATLASKELREFVASYRRHMARRPRGAMTTTARELNISRATAYRRLDAARAAGLLPQKDDS